MEISVISPVYKAENHIEELVGRLDNVLSSICDSYEIILVDDNSPDNSWEKISKISVSNSYVKGISLSRNFGQHNAITAGLSISSGEWVIVMDCDLQDVPEEIPSLLNRAKRNNVDIVLAQRIERQDNWLKRKLSQLFYMFLSYLTGVKFDESVANFGVYHQKVIKSIMSMNDSVKFLPLMAIWVGFKKEYQPVIHAARNGKSSYDFKKRLLLALDVFLSYSDRPLRLFLKFGIFISISSLISSVYYFYLWFSGSIKVVGFTTMVISLWFLTGLIISMLGIVGLYIGKIFNQVKNRPNYIIRDQTF